MSLRPIIRGAARLAAIGVFVGSALVLSSTPASADAAGSDDARETVQTVEFGGCIATFSTTYAVVPFVPLWASYADVHLSVSCATSTLVVETAVAIVPLGDAPLLTYTPADADACTNCTELSSTASFGGFQVVGCSTAVGTAVAAPNTEPVRFFTRLC